MVTPAIETVERQHASFSHARLCNRTSVLVSNVYRRPVILSAAHVAHPRRPAFGAVSGGGGGGGGSPMDVARSRSYNAVYEDAVYVLQGVVR